MLLFLADRGVGRHTVGGRIGQHHARLALQLFQLVELRVPLLVGHEFSTTIIICVGSAVELLDECPHLNSYVHFHDFMIASLAFRQQQRLSKHRQTYKKRIE